MGDTRAADEITAPLPPRIAVSANDLDLAVSRGIISAEQRDSLLALRTGDVPEFSEVAEAREGLNLVTIGYWAGSVAVLFALAWFLADRWKSLRPAGVLAVALLYALSFALSSAFLMRLGYRIAASLLALLTVAMAPIITWSIESMLGVWPAPTIQRFSYGADVIESVRWIPLQLSLALAGLIALRKVPFGLLVLTVAIPMGMALVQLTPLVFDPELTFSLSAWMTLFAGTLMFLAGYLLDRRLPGHAEDYAGWVYLCALGFLFVGLMGTLDESLVIRHMLPAVVALLIAIGFTLRRRVFLLPAALVFITYLTFLAKEVFPSATGFMVVMLAVGALLILGTVVLQRRFPQILHRFTGEGTARPALPSVGVVYALLAAMSAVLLFTAVPRARAELARRQERRNEEYRATVERQRAQANAVRLRAKQRDETRGAVKP